MKALRILIVEDDALVAILLAELLETLGHSICAIAATESEAVAEAVRCKPDMMIVDAQLREGAGMGAVDRIQRGGVVAHVFVSGDALPIRTLRPLATVIQKPYFEQDLICAMAQALDVVAA